RMSRFLRGRLLLPASALFLTVAAADIFGQSSSIAADVSNAASPNKTASSNLTSRTAATLKSPSTVGNFPIIVPSRLNGGPGTSKVTNKAMNTATDKAEGKSGEDNDSANGDPATPPSPPSPTPQAGFSSVSGRTFSRSRNGPQQFNA